jgi:PAS domain S-box-containing protein
MIAVLYVDEEAGMRDVAQLYLQRSGDMIVDTVPSGIHALESVTNRRYDVIVSDYHMPGLNGIELLKRLRGTGDKTPFILFTGRGREEVVIEALNNGASFYLQKGGNPKAQFAELQHMIEQAVERRRIEASLRLTQYSVDCASDEVFWFDPAGKFIYVNDAACYSLGYSRDELLKMSVHDIDPNYPQSLWADRICQLREKGSVTIESRHKKKDGTTFPVEITCNYFTLNGTEYIFAFSRDITTRKQAEEALQESERFFRTVIDNMLDATVILDWDGKVLFANRAAAHLVGLTSRETNADLNVVDFVFPEFRESLKYDLDLVRRDQGGFLAEYRIRSADGRDKWVECIGARIRFRGSYADLVSIRDITERKTAEEALRLSEEKFRAVFHNANDAITLNEIAPDGRPGRFVEVNDLACARLGYTREEFLSLTPDDLGIMDVIGSRPDLLETLREGKPVTFEMTLISRGGVQVPAEISSHIFMLGKRPMIISIGRDVTERKMTEQIEKKAFEQIEKNISQLAILGDHVRNPLAVIVALADMDPSENAKKIVKQAKIIDDLITQA